MSVSRLLALVLVVSLPVWWIQPFSEWFPAGSDLGQHVYMAEGHVDAWGEGRAASLWDSKRSSGLGEPRGLVYPPLFHLLIAGAAEVSGLQLTTCVGLVYGLFYSLGLAVALAWLHERGSFAAAAWGGALYLAVPVWLTLNAYPGLHAYGAAAALFPLFLWLLDRCLSVTRPRTIALSIGLSAWSRR